nr:hypothetical protein [Tanacetum cinerariifolium]
MDQQNPTLAKIPILDIGKFEQWQFRIQQYLQHEHYALWEVIEFEDSYEAPINVVTTCITSDGTGKKKGRTVTLTDDDMQKRKNDVKARTTLLLSLPNEHQLQFSKYKTTQELWATILKTFGGNKATKKTKKNLLKQQYGNFKAEGSETLEQMFNRLHVIVIWRNISDLDTMSLDDLYNYLKVYESEVQKKSEPNSQNMAFISSAKHSSGNEEINTASVSTASTNVSTASANIGTWHGLISRRLNASTVIRWVTLGRRDNYNQWSKVKEHAPKALMAIDGVGWDWSYMANDEENNALIADEETPTEFALMAKTGAESEGLDSKLAGFQTASKDIDSLLESQRLDKNKEGLGYSVVPPPPAQVYSPPKKDLSWNGLPEFKDDTVTDYSRPSPAIESTSDDA